MTIKRPEIVKLGYPIVCGLRIKIYFFLLFCSVVRVINESLYL